MTAIDFAAFVDELAAVSGETVVSSGGVTDALVCVDCATRCVRVAGR